MLPTTPLVIKSAQDQVDEVLRREMGQTTGPGLPLPLGRIAERLGVSERLTRRLAPTTQPADRLHA